MEGENRRDEYPAIDDQPNTGDFSGPVEENGENHQEISSKFPLSEEEELPDQNPKKNQIIEKLKIGGVAIGVIVISLVSYFQFMKTVNMPVTNLFAGEDVVANGTTNTEACVGGNCELQNKILALLAQQKQDTDSDGLSDYEEFYVYQTSPFLEDTDSDSYSDKTETDSGKNPNCPAGADCFADLADPTGSGETGQSAIDPGVQKFAAGQANSQTLRQILLQSGFPKEGLDLITDDQLVLMYQQVMSGANPDFDAIIAGDSGAGNTSTTTNANTPIDATDLTSIEDLQALSGAQIRELMISQGATKDMLAAYTDEELKQMFIGQLQERINNSN